MNASLLWTNISLPHACLSVYRRGGGRGGRGGGWMEEVVQEEMKDGGINIINPD